MWCARYLCRILSKLQLSRQFFRKILNHKTSWKSVQRKSNSSMQTDGRTDTTKLIVAFRNFANAPNNYYTWIADLQIERETPNFVFYFTFSLFCTPDKFSVFQPFCGTENVKPITSLTRCSMSRPISEKTAMILPSSAGSCGRVGRKSPSNISVKKKTRDIRSGHLGGQRTAHGLFVKRRVQR